MDVLLSEELDTDELLGFILNVFFSSPSFLISLYLRACVETLGNGSGISLGRGRILLCLLKLFSALYTVQGKSQTQFCTSDLSIRLSVQWFSSLLP